MGATWRPGSRTGGTVVGGGVALLQHHHGVMDVLVHKLHPHRRSCHQHPRHPSTGQRLCPPFVGNDILYVLGPPSVWGAQRCRRVAALPCRVIR